ncbi:hypothetical protein D9M69_667280 [compost metagenome]
MPAHVLQRQRHHHAPPEGHRRAHAQEALRLVLPQLHDAVGLLRVAHDGLALLVVQRARLREAHAARVAVEQPHLQARLRGRDLLGHGGLRGVELARRLREAAGLDDPHKHFHSQ